ncbi:virulence factor [Halomonas urumqiensis]|uniref:Virulence factor domain-containing protein n=1 Tax=Halomonas urumqiensis TaxID=1684789 RepID=A0A2N7UC78_9GAMM|nr:virulence factor [Halomonas urumqiensis]PMR78048.1 hypothetical protein C1H70_14785 [Halomonas urumqiensis]PTB03199.1 hypothetical protein C6V82_01420 [Halomonas urumqiensis]GHE20653.1 hypothetical protein GCM10017767_11740 [Halomonas urumqiensis]
MAMLSIVSWRDIPAQVIVKRGRQTAKVILPERFQHAIDRAAMRAGKGGSEAYLADWKRSVPRPCGDDLKVEADAEAARIDQAYDAAMLKRLVSDKGLDLTPGETSSTAEPPGEAENTD